MRRAASGDRDARYASCTARLARISAGGPEAMTWPYTSTVTTSATSKTTLMFVPTITSVFPAVTRRIQGDRVIGLAAAHPAVLVEQDGVGPARDRDADLERALLGVGEEAGGHVAARFQVHVGEQARGRVG